MITKHPSFRFPKRQSVKLWRYMDLSKFIHLLQSQSLYFARADQLGDPFEGSSPRAQAALSNQSPTDDSTLSEEDLRFRRVFSTFRAENVKNAFVSCWHESDHESSAMWRLYSQSTDAVAIQTTFEKLCAALPEYVFMGEVQYIDYEKAVIDDWNALSFLTRKRISFEHGREVRALIWSIDGRIRDKKADDGRLEIGELGAEIKINLDAFVEKIFVSPSAPSWFAAVVTNVVKKYGLDAPVEYSTLAASPLW